MYDSEVYIKSCILDSDTSCKDPNLFGPLGLRSDGLRTRLGPPARGCHFLCAHRVSASLVRMTESIGQFLDYWITATFTPLSARHDKHCVGDLVIREYSTVLLQQFLLFASAPTEYVFCSCARLIPSFPPATFFGVQHQLYIFFV